MEKRMVGIKLRRPAATVRAGYRSKLTTDERSIHEMVDGEK